MFPRKKKNRTGTISVVVVDKSRRGFKEIKNFGVAKTEEEADRLYAKAAEWVRRYGGQQEIDFVQSSVIQQEFLESERVLNNISAVVLNGPQQILNQVYDSIGFNRIRDEVLRHLVIARICQPLSKSATADYLKSYFHEDVSLDQIYRYTDKLYNKQRELVQQISVEHTRKILGGSIGLIVGYSEQRAKKDAHNREKGIERLRKAYSSGVLTKASINKRGYNKFLTISKDVQVVINEQEIEKDKKWDGQKGYVTNTDLDAGQVVTQYHSLWYVERAFRVTNGNLEARPIFHFTEKRIEAHICICFIAYKVYKELQRIIALHGGINLSVDKVIDIAKTIPTIKLSLPYGDTERVKTLFLTEKHQRIKPLFDIKAILDKKQK